jgi:hypothetical protein
MSSVNFTGLSNIKVGSADCTVYLGANKMWPLGPSMVSKYKIFDNGTWIDGGQWWKGNYYYNSSSSPAESDITSVYCSHFDNLRSHYKVWSGTGIDSFKDTIAAYSPSKFGIYAYYISKESTMTSNSSVFVNCMKKTSVDFISCGCANSVRYAFYMRDCQQLKLSVATTAVDSTVLIDGYDNTSFTITKNYSTITLKSDNGWFVLNSEQPSESGFVYVAIKSIEALSSFSLKYSLTQDMIGYKYYGREYNNMKATSSWGNNTAFESKYISHSTINYNNLDTFKSAIMKTGIDYAIYGSYSFSGPSKSDFYGIFGIDSSNKFLINNLYSSYKLIFYFKDCNKLVLEGLRQTDSYYGNSRTFFDVVNNKSYYTSTDKSIYITSTSKDGWFIFTLKDSNSSEFSIDSVKAYIS